MEENRWASSYQINAIATRALVDVDFKQAILNGQRRQRLQEFQLPVEVVDAIMKIQGNDIHQFIFQLNNLAATKKIPTFRDSTKAVPTQRHCDHE
jgi:hypothetical protein